MTDSQRQNPDVSEIWAIVQQQRERIQELEAVMARRSRRRSPAGRLPLVLLAALSALAVTSNAFASIPDTNGLVTFCYAANATDTRIIDTANSTCKSYEHSIALLTQSSSVNAGHITGVLPVANGGTGSSTQNFVDLSTNQTIGGTKTFSNTIGGSISGNAAGFTGSLSGDVTGTQSSTKVTGIESQGIMGAGTAAGQYLRFDGAHWTPSTIQTGDIPDLSSSYVSLSGDQTIGGTKKFSNEITFGDGSTQQSAVINPTLFCPQCSKEGANLSVEYLMGAYFPDSDLSSANLDQATLGGADLYDGNLTLATLNQTYLAGANMTYATLTDANLTGAVMIDANLTGATLVDANLTGAALTYATLNRANLTGVTWSNTICPDGTDSNNDGDTCIGHLTP